MTADKVPPLSGHLLRTTRLLTPGTPEHCQRPPVRADERPVVCSTGTYFLLLIPVISYEKT